MDPNENTLTEDQIADQISKAVFAGDNDAIEKLMSQEAKPVEEPVVNGNENQANNVTNAVTEEVTADKNVPNATDTQVKAETPSTDVTVPVDDVAKLKEEVERLRRIEHSYKSGMGRTPSLQRKLAEAERELENLRKGVVSNTPVPSTAKAPSGKIGDKLKQLKDTDPYLAEIFEEVYAEVHSSKDEAKNVLREREVEELLRNEADKLVSYHPQAFEVFDLPEWQVWKNNQTPGMVALAESQYADDVIRAFQYFYNDMYPKKWQPVANAGATHNAQTQPNQQVTPQVGQSTTAQPASPADPRAAKVEQERNRKLEANNLGTKPAALEGDGLPTDEDKLHDYYYKQALKDLGLYKPK